jgi:hypothetical protein
MQLTVLFFLHSHLRQQHELSVVYGMVDQHELFEDGKMFQVM